MTTASNQPNQPSIADLTNGMKQLAQSGAGKELRLSRTACQNYLQVIAAFRQQLSDLKDQAATLTTYGNPGGFHSAIQTVWQLQDAVTDADKGLVPSLAGYITYLDEFENTVKAALTRIQAEDKS